MAQGLPSSSPKRNFLALPNAKSDPTEPGLFGRDDDKLKFRELNGTVRTLATTDDLIANTDTTYWQRVVSTNTELEDALESTDSFFLKAGSYSIDPSTLTIPFAGRCIIGEGRQATLISLTGTEGLKFPFALDGSTNKGVGTSLDELRVIGSTTATNPTIEDARGCLRVMSTSLASTQPSFKGCTDLTGCLATVTANSTNAYENCVGVIECTAIRGSYTGGYAFYNCRRIIGAHIEGWSAANYYGSSDSVLTEDIMEAAYAANSPSKANPLATQSDLALATVTDIREITGLEIRAGDTLRTHSPSALAQSECAILSGAEGIMWDTAGGVSPTVSLPFSLASELLLDMTTTPGSLLALDTSTPAVDTWYYIYICSWTASPTTFTACFSSSSASPHSSWLTTHSVDVYRRVGAVRTSSGVATDLQNRVQLGNFAEVAYDCDGNHNIGSLPSTATTALYSCNNAIPATVRKFNLYCVIKYTHGQKIWWASPEWENTGVNCIGAHRALRILESYVQDKNATAVIEHQAYCDDSQNIILAGWGSCSVSIHSYWDEL